MQTAGLESCAGASFLAVETSIRCRHHTSPEGLEGIRQDNAINPSRGEPMGVDVEVEPFGTLNPFSRLSPRATTGAYGEGAYVEFDLPEGAIPEPDIGPRNNMRIPTTTPLSLIGLKPVFVRVRWWQVWKWWDWKVVEVERESQWP